MTQKIGAGRQGENFGCDHLASHQEWGNKKERLWKGNRGYNVHGKKYCLPYRQQFGEHRAQEAVQISQKAWPQAASKLQPIASRVAMMVSRYAHAKQYKRMRGSVKQINTYLGRVVRDIERQVARIREKVAIFSDLIGLSPNP